MAKVSKATVTIARARARGLTAHKRRPAASNDRALLIARAFKSAKPLLSSKSVLSLLRTELNRLGMVGDLSVPLVIYLAITTRLLNKPVSMVVKGPSGMGKSFAVDTVVRFFSSTAICRSSTLTPKALSYLGDLQHRTLVVEEEDGIDDPFLRSQLRTLLTEGELRHRTVSGGQAKERVVLGPTNLVTTTTKPQLHHETETRVLSLHVDDSPKVKRAIMKARSKAELGESLEIPQSWIDLQKYLALKRKEVVVPFEAALADLMPDGVMPRDFQRLTKLIAAHALLHVRHRETTTLGHVIAVPYDYDVVRQLILPHFEEAVEAAVPQRIKEVVAAVTELRKSHPTVTLTQLGAKMGLHRSNASRRLQDAFAEGYVLNVETNAAKPARLITGQPLPASGGGLPTVDALREKIAALKVARKAPKAKKKPALEKLTKAVHKAGRLPQKLRST